MLTLSSFTIRSRVRTNADLTSSSTVDADGINGSGRRAFIKAMKPRPSTVSKGKAAFETQRTIWALITVRKPLSVKEYQTLA
jgi:hypothetical protein